MTLQFLYTVCMYARARDCKCPCIGLYTPVCMWLYVPVYWAVRPRVQECTCPCIGLGARGWECTCRVSDCTRPCMGMYVTVYWTRRPWMGVYVPCIGLYSPVYGSVRARVWECKALHMGGKKCRLECRNANAGVPTAAHSLGPGNGTVGARGIWEHVGRRSTWDGGAPEMGETVGWGSTWDVGVRVIGGTHGIWEHVGRGTF